MNRTDHARRQEQGRTREVRSAWIEAVRLRTLPLAASGSVVAAGIAAIAAAVLYTVGPHPYGYIGLGDAMSFLFFGIVHEPDHTKFDRFMAPTSLGTVAVALVFTLCAVLG